MGEYKPMVDNKPYVFISYAHKDSAVVLPCINALQQNNINLWYDEGIQAGSEWPEYIAEKVLNCEKFVLFISKAYLASQNCKRELNFAISRKKDILSIFIEDVELSPGMEMQLGTYQSIFKNRFANDAAFHTSVSNEQWFDSCRIQPAAAKEVAPVQQQPVTPVTPVKPVVPVTPVVPVPPMQQIPFMQQVPPMQPAFATMGLPVKSRLVTVLLAFILGYFGAPFFYLKKKWLGIGCCVVSLLSLLALVLVIPFLINIVLGIVFWALPAEKFQKQYGCQLK